MKLQTFIYNQEQGDNSLEQLTFMDFPVVVVLNNIKYLFRR
jgi:hypothetical protein